MNDSELEHKFIFLHHQVTYYFIIYITPIGIVGNIITVLISIRKNLNKTNMGFFYITMAVTNLMQLLFYVFIQESHEVFKYNPLIESDFSCKILMYIRRIIRQASPLIEAIMTFDRLLSVYIPRKTFFHKWQFMLILFSIILGLFSVINISNLFFYVESIFDPYENRTELYCTSSTFNMELTDVTSTVLRTFIPFVTMLLFNILIAKKMMGSKAKIAASGKSLRRQYQFTITVIGMNGFFLILNLPLSIYFIIKYFGIKYLAIIGEFVYAIVYCLSTLHYASLFFICIFCNSIFLNELLVTLRIKKNVISQVSPSATNGTRQTSNSKR